MERVNGEGSKETAARADGASHTIGRLESFSDVVIGFCIAEMGVNLFIPKTPAELPSIFLSAAGFAFSFVLIAILWWIHHRLFRSFFVLSATTLILNCAMLGSVVLMVYFQQICLHFIAIGADARSAFQLWFLSYGAVYALLAAMLWMGVRARWTTMPVSDLRWGFTRAAVVSLSALVFVSYSAILGTPHTSRSLLLGGPLVLIVAIRLVVPRIVDRFIVRRV